MQPPCACVDVCVKGVADSYKGAVLYDTYVPGTGLYTIVHTVYSMCGDTRHAVRVYTVCMCMHVVCFVNYCCYLPKHFHNQYVFVMQT